MVMLNHTYEFRLMSMNKCQMLNFDSYGEEMANDIEQAFSHCHCVWGGNVNAIYVCEENTPELFLNLEQKWDNATNHAIRSLSRFFNGKNIKTGECFIKQMTWAPVADQIRSYRIIESMRQGKDWYKEDQKFSVTWLRLYVMFKTLSFGWCDEDVFVGDATKGNRHCRYCDCTDDSKFSKDAHAISESLGNKHVFSNEECDDCNEFFSHKALVKYVVGLLPNDELPHFKNTIEWLKGRLVDNDLPTIWMGIHDHLFRQPVLDIYINEKGLSNTPYCTGLLYTCDVVYMFVVPFVDVDNGRFMKDESLASHWRMMKRYNYYAHVWYPQASSEFWKGNTWVNWVMKPGEYRILSSSDPVFGDDDIKVDKQEEMTFPDVRSLGMKVVGIRDVEFNLLTQRQVAVEEMNKCSINLLLNKLVVSADWMEAELYFQILVSDTNNQERFYELHFTSKIKAERPLSSNIAVEEIVTEGKDVDGRSSSNVTGSINTYSTNATQETLFVFNPCKPVLAGTCTVLRLVVRDGNRCVPLGNPTFRFNDVVALVFAVLGSMAAMAMPKRMSETGNKWVRGDWQVP